MNQAPSKTESRLPTAFERFVWRRKYWLIFLAFSITFVATRLLAPAPHEYARTSSGLQEAHAIGLAMYSYANDHDGKYPTGTSSTEVFQQLIDQGYVTNPTLFYLHMAGKIKATGQKLKPENVCFDVTQGVVASDTDGLPLIFYTGCKIKYAPSGKAQPLIDYDQDGIAVFYKDNSAKFALANPTGGIPLIDPTFDPKGKTYRQLTPDGLLP